MLLHPRNLVFVLQKIPYCLSYFSSSICNQSLTLDVTSSSSLRVSKRKNRFPKAMFAPVKGFTKSPDFTEISMGMSQDYPIAIKEGSTLIRLGSKIFGERIY